MEVFIFIYRNYCTVVDDIVQSHTDFLSLGGYYVFFETSVGSAGDNAQLGSPPLSLNTPRTCLVFYYTMYGENVGKVSQHRMQTHVMYLK